MKVLIDVWRKWEYLLNGYTYYKNKISEGVSIVFCVFIGSIYCFFAFKDLSNLELPLSYGFKI